MKTKKIIYGILASFLLMPMAVLAGWGDTGLHNADNSNLPDGRILQIIINIMNWLLAIVGVIGIIGFVISGIMYFLAAGDSGKMGDAKNAMIYSIIGVVVALMGYVIIQAVNTMLGGVKTDF